MRSGLPASLRWASVEVGAFSQGPPSTPPPPNAPHIPPQGPSPAMGPHLGPVHGPLYQGHPSHARGQEFERVRKGVPLQALDVKRYEIPQPSAAHRSDVGKWREAVDNAHAQVCGGVTAECSARGRRACARVCLHMCVCECVAGRVCACLRARACVCAPVCPTSFEAHAWPCAGPAPGDVCARLRVRVRVRVCVTGADCLRGPCGTEKGAMPLSSAASRGTGTRTIDSCACACDFRVGYASPSSSEPPPKNSYFKTATQSPGVEDCHPSTGMSRP